MYLFHTGLKLTEIINKLFLTYLMVFLNKPISENADTLIYVEIEARAVKILFVYVWVIAMQPLSQYYCKGIL